MRKNADDDPFGGGGIGLPVGVTAAETDRVDVHEYDDRVTVVADIPGVSEDTLDLQCDGRTLAIHVMNGTRPVGVRVDLPAYVDAGSMESTLNNGVLKVGLTRDRDPADIGFR
jgi:HSP20 family protein